MIIAFHYKSRCEGAQSRPVNSRQKCLNVSTWESLKWIKTSVNITICVNRRRTYIHRIDTAGTKASGKLLNYYVEWQPLAIQGRWLRTIISYYIWYNGVLEHATAASFFYVVWLWGFESMSSILVLRMMTLIIPRSCRVSLIELFVIVSSSRVVWPCVVVCPLYIFYVIPKSRPGVAKVFDISYHAQAS